MKPLSPPRRARAFRAPRMAQAFRAARSAIAAGAALAAAFTPALAQAGLIRDAEVERTLGRMINPIFDVAGLSGRVRLFIIEDNSLNAFVAGGNNMFFHTGLLRQLETPEELIGVMAHETGHITSGHFVQRVAAIESAQTASILTTIAGIGAAAAGAGSAAVGASQGGQHILQRELAKFSRAQEAGADLEALRFMNAIDVDPVGMLKVLKRLEAQQSVFLTNINPYTLSHPLSRERIITLQRGVDSSPAHGRSVSPELRYWHGRMRAKLDGFLSPAGAAARESFGDPELDLYREAIALHRTPLPDKAIAAADQLIAMRPNDPYYWELKGQILFESGRGPKAVEPYERAVKLAPDEPLIAAGLGEALLTLKTPEADKRALRVLEQVAIAEPYNAAARRPLAIAYARTGQDGMAAVVSAEQLALQGNLKGAKRQALVAKEKLPVGSPGWLRAEDVMSLKGRE